MFEDDFADTCAKNFPIMSIGGRAEDLACTDPGARISIGVIGFFADVAMAMLTVSSDFSHFFSYYLIYPFCGKLM